ncbi:coatomer delta subunit [Cyclospora cayetanensis]|uniref:Coatomer subunit delta n=1 Tax=Cyclospora cayetanensis TaxID=88456 RepID=A0A1D3D241_9EIME|nr:coatomer delta subunit [Cyclospora cayetanensis]
MVVIGACITSRVRPLLARQFVDIRKAKVEGLLNAFLKLVDYSGSDHTYLETESVRYVYQPVENLYLVLITTKSSNIFEDLGTLRMFDTCGEGHSSSSSLEESVAAHAFDIIFMLDELISGGYREALTLQQIQSFVAMDSHEEKLQKMIAEGKEKEQADRMREIAQRLEKERQAAKKAGKGLDIASFRGALASPQLSRGPTPAVSAPDTGAPTEHYWGAGSAPGGVYDSRSQASPGESSGAPPRGSQQAKGMQLGMKRTHGGDDGLLQSLVQDEHTNPSGGYGEEVHQQEGKCFD